MSKFVDERVVEMSFDNKKFESNVKTSMGTINKLKDSLDFSDVSKKINKNLNGVDTGGLSSGIGSLGKSLSTLEVVGIAALANITNRLVDMGIELTKALLGIDQLTSGWSKFQEVSTSEATLLAQGYDSAVVTKAIEDLLWFTDETSYAFTEMMNNMSKFTAAGISLEDAQQSMMGIANWAALSGQNASTASRVMYQLSQAMGSGVIKLQDWKSIETANMATKEFKDSILETAVAMGTLTKNVDGTFTTLTGKTFEGTQFRDFLSEGFLTSDVLTKTLESYSSVALEVQEMMADDSSLTTASKALDAYEKKVNSLQDELDNALISDEERAKRQKEIDDMRFGIRAFRAAQEARTFTDAVNSVKDAVSTGWTKIFRNIFGGVDEAKVLWTDLANSLYDVFMDGMWRKIDILNVWGELGGRDDLWANTEENTGAFWNLFNALLAIKDLISGSWSKVFGLSQLEDADEQVNDIANKLKTFTSNLKDFTAKLVMSEATSEKLSKILTGLFSVLKIGGQLIISIVKGMKPLLSIMGSALNFVINMFSKVGNSITDIAKTTKVFDTITNTLQKFFNGLINFVKGLKILDGIKIFIESFNTALKGLTKSSDDVGKKQSIFKTIIDGLTKAFTWLGDVLTKYLAPVLPKVFNILGTSLGWLVGLIMKLFNSIGMLFNRFKEWAKNNVIFQNGILLLKKVLDTLSNTFKSLWKNISGFFDSFGTVNTKPVDDFTEEVETKLSPLQTFLQGLANLFKGLWSVVKAIIPAIGALFTFIGKGLSYIGDKLKSMFSTEDGGVNFQKIFTTGFWALVIVGIYRFADTLRSVLDVFTDAFDSVFDYFNSAAMKQYMEAIKTMAISILLMVGALLILGSMETGTLIKATTALTVLIAVIVGVMLAMKNLTTVNITKVGKKMKMTTTTIGQLGAAFIGLGVAMLLLAFALKKISSLNMPDLLISLGVVALLMYMLTKVMRSVGDADKQTNKAVKSMVKMAVSISLLVVPLNRIGKIDTVTGIKGLIGIGILMALLTGYSKFAKPIEKSQKSIQGLMSTAIALTLLTIPLKIIGKMSWETLGKTGVVIASLFTIFAVISKVMNQKDVNNLNSITTSLIKFSGSMILFGLAMMIIRSNDWIDLGITGAAILGLMTILTTMSKSMKLKDANRLKAISKQLSLIALSLAAMGISMMILGSNSWGNITKSLVAITGVFTAITAMNKVLGKHLTAPRVNNINTIMKAMIPMALAMGMFGVSMKIMSTMNWPQILKGVGGMSLVLLMIVGLVKLIKMVGTDASGLALLGLSLITLSIGLITLSGALVLFGNMKLETLGKGLLAITGVFVVLAISGLLLKPLIPVLLTLTITFVAFALGVFLLATSLTLLVGIITISAAAFAAGLIAISSAVVLATPMIMKALWAIINGFLDIVVKSIPLIVAAMLTMVLEVVKAVEVLVKPIMALLVNIVLEIIESIKTVLPATISLVIDILEQFLTNIVRIFPLITNTLLSLFLSVLDTMYVRLPELVNKMVDLFIGFIKALRVRLPEIFAELNLLMIDLVDNAVSSLIEQTPKMVNAGFNLLIGLLDGIGNTLSERAPEVREAIIRFAENIWNAFLGFFGINSPSTKFIEAAGHMISGIIEGLWSGLTRLITSIGAWSKEIFNSITKFFGEAFNKGKDLINGIHNGAKNVWGGVSTWFGNTAKSISGSFSSKVGDMKSAGSDLINGLKNGLETTGDKLKETAKNVGGKLTGWFKDVFGIKSPSRVFAEIGKFLDLGLARGMEDNSGVAYNAAESLADDTIDGFEQSGLSKVLSDLNTSLLSDFDNEIVIRPVLDLSEIQNGKNRMNSIMSSDYGYGISGSNQIARSTRDDINSKNIESKSNTGNNDSPTQTQTSDIINNTFNISGSNPKEIAEEVSRVLQTQVERRKAKWAL